MTYHVEITEFAERDMRSAHRWWADNRSKHQADRWYTGFANEIASLSVNPERQPQSRESHWFGIELRDLVFGTGRRPTHRAVFTIRGDSVVVLTIRHLAQADLSAEDVAMESD